VSYKRGHFVSPLKRQPQNAPAAIAGCAKKEDFHNRTSSLTTRPEFPIWTEPRPVSWHRLSGQAPNELFPPSRRVDKSPSRDARACHGHRTSVFAHPGRPLQRHARWLELAPHAVVSCAAAITSRATRVARCAPESARTGGVSSGFRQAGG